MAETVIDQHLDKTAPSGRRKRKHRRGFQARSGNYNWRLSSGKVVPMASMTDEHLASALKTCEDRDNVHKARQLREVLEARTASREDPSA
jgi:hypothetical protein